LTKIPPCVGGPVFQDTVYKDIPTGLEPRVKVWTGIKDQLDKDYH